MRYTNTTLCLLALASGCASLPTLAESEQRELGGFTAIEVENGIDLTLSQGDFEVEVEAKDGDVGNIVTEVRNATLYLSLSSDAWGERRNGWFRRNDFDRYRAAITLPVLESVDASGGSDLRSKGKLSGDSLELELSGGSDARLELDYDAVDISASGGSDLDLEGRVDRLDVTASGGSDMNARDLDTREVTLKASGGSDASISVSESLSIRASGGSDVTYYGEPAHRDIDNSGSSDVTRRPSRFDD